MGDVEVKTHVFLGSEMSSELHAGIIDENWRGEPGR
jgi:hypothetical protein